MTENSHYKKVKTVLGYLQQITFRALEARAKGGGGRQRQNEDQDGEGVIEKRTETGRQQTLFLSKMHLVPLKQGQLHAPACFPQSFGVTILKL